LKSRPPSRRVSISLVRREVFTDNQVTRHEATTLSPRSLCPCPFGIDLQRQTQPAVTPTPAEYEIDAARQAIAKHPNQVSGYNDLAIGFIDRATETGNSGFYNEADASLKNAIRVAPNSYESRKIEVVVFQGLHAFAAARSAAEKLNKLVPDDVPVYGMLAEADIALGNYADAEKQVQMMLTLRQDTAPAMERVAQLRELFGDLDGAIDAWRKALSQTSPSETGEFARLLTGYARTRLLNGDDRNAAIFCEGALQKLPRYAPALSALSEIRSAQGRHADAVRLLKQCMDFSPSLNVKYELALALHGAGNEKEAEPIFDEFARDARARITLDDNANFNLVGYDLDYGKNPDEALAVAKQELSRRHDIWTLDAYARALAANGNPSEARKQLRLALDIGVKEPRIFYDTGIVETLLDDREAAKGYFEKVIGGQVKSVYYDPAEKALAQLALLAPKTGR
jgi:tetratricopeptide (TPR) repeat protein